MPRDGALPYLSKVSIDVAAQAAVVASPISPAYWLVFPSAGETMLAAAVKTLACRNCCVHHSLAYVATSDASPAALPSASARRPALLQLRARLRLGLRDTLGLAALVLGLGSATWTCRVERRRFVVLDMAEAQKAESSLDMQSACGLPDRHRVH